MRHDMMLTIEKLTARMRELEQHIYFGHIETGPFSATDVLPGGNQPNINIPARIEGARLALGDDFTGRDVYLWAQKDITLPKALPGGVLVGLFDFGKTGPGYNSGFEALLYVNGSPCQGVDTNHKDVVLQDYAGQEVNLTFMMWSGLEGGGKPAEQNHRIKTAQLAYLHLATDELYYYAKAICKTLALLPDTAPEKYALMQALDGAFLVLDWSDVRGTAQAALDALKARLAATPKHSEVTVNVVGHTHIDMAWLWRLKHTREKAVRSFSTVLRLMEEFPEYVFLQSQPQLYKYVQQDCPELFAKIKARIAEGRWEADGGMWVEADCNVSGGEALVRQFLYGIQYMQAEFGKSCEYLWLPDVFGYSWALPQILRQCNIKTFMTTKISWNQYNCIPHDLFTWRGIDGSEILTYFITTPEVGYAPDSRFSTYNGQISPRTVLGSWQKFKDKDISRETLISYGYGDGGGGVNRNMLKMRRVLDELPGLPHVKQAKPSEFFNRIHEKAAEQELHTWDGELYLEYHRGTYTSQAGNKQKNRRMEFALANSEALASLGWLSGGQYPQALLGGLWEDLLLLQFHDIIPGSSIREVYRDSDEMYLNMQTQLNGLDNRYVQGLAAPDAHSVVLHNPGWVSGKTLVETPLQGTGQLVHCAGGVVPSQPVEGGLLALVDVDALSLGSLSLVPGAAAPQPPLCSVQLHQRRVESPLVAIEWDADGTLCSVVDKIAQRQLLAGRGNQLVLFEDKPLNYDNWDIDIFHTEKYTNLSAQSIVLVENGSLRTTIRFTYQLGCSEIVQDMVLYAHTPRVDFVTRVDWHETNQLLKTRFPLDIRATKASYDIQFGYVERPTHHNTSWDWARFEVVGHKWADISEADYGVSLLNDCKYGYSVKDNTMSLTLLKSTKYPDTEMDMGTHNFTYSLFPHQGTVAQGGTIEESVLLNQPVRVWQGKLSRPVPPAVTVEGGVAIDAVKKAEKEDCLIVRIHECRGARCKARITSHYGVKGYTPCNLLEQDTGEKTSAAEFTAQLKPFEIQTYKLWF